MLDSSTLIIIPTYNEANTVQPMITTLFKLGSEQLHIVIVDDNSPDNTHVHVDALKEQFPGQLFLIKRSKKEGIGPAYIAGFQFALEKGYSRVCQMDCDFSHDPYCVMDFIEFFQSNKADVAIGSRYIKGQGIKDWVFRRLLISKGAAFYIRSMLSLPVKDPTAGFSIIGSSALRHIVSHPNLTLCKGFGFQVWIKYIAYKAGFRLCEFPIEFTQRQIGKSKFSFFIFIEALLKVPFMRFYV